MQEAGSSLPGSGTYVYLGANWELSWGLVNRGDAVEVTGEYREFFDLTEINVIDSPSGDVFITGVGVSPAAAVLTLADLALNPESWEGVLVEITSPMVSGLPDAFGAWVVSDGINNLVVDDDMYAPGSLTLGQTFTSIRGPLTYAFSEYRLLPRDAADLL